MTRASPRWNPARFPTTAIEQSIPQRFALAVERHGDREAIVTEAGRVSYRELDRLSNRIAHCLLQRRLVQGETVGVMIEQGISQIAAILGVLKCGAIYVPLDAALTRQRLGEILDDAEPTVIVTDRLNESLARLVGGARRHALNLDIDLSSFPTEAPVVRAAPDAFVYVYYTSGSTGAAKGVVDDHRNVLHNIARYTSSLGITCEDRLTLLQSCGFSGAVSNLFGALLNGATLLPFDVRGRGVAALADWLVAQAPTIYHSVPSLFRRVMACASSLPSVRLIRLEGDIARGIDLAVFNRHFDARCVLVNGLGATETGIAAQHFIEHGAREDGPVLPVGRATRDMHIDVVDEQGRSVPAGELGEVVITSRFLARGYWRRPDLTGAAFQTVDAATRAYRTRDLGRLDAAGRLQCHGRVDLLAKVHGQWVDLGAIERSLTQCAGVQDALATVADDAAGNPRLLAFVVPAAGVAASAESLRTALLERALPEHAMPSKFVITKRWPLDVNGKVDRKALVMQADVPRTDDAPQTPTERVVAAAFCRALKLPSVSLTDDFFELGGDSLAATELSLELGRRMGSERALGAIQHASTVAALARSIDGGFGSASLVPLQPRGWQRPLFIVHAHMGHVFNLRELARQFAPDRPLYGLQAKGLDGIDRPPTRLEAMAAAYVADIRAVQPRGPYRVGGYCFGSWVAIEMARQLLDAGEHVDPLLLIAPDLPPGVAPARRRAAVAHRALALWDRIRPAPLRNLADWAGQRIATRRAEGRTWLLSQAARLDLFQRLPRSWVDVPGAIAVMQRIYRPRPYRGRAVVLTAAGQRGDEATRDAWTWWIAGGVEFVPLAGDAWQILRPPHVRDTAASIMARASP